MRLQKSVRWVGIAVALSLLVAGRAQAEAPSVLGPGSTAPSASADRFVLLAIDAGAMALTAGGLLLGRPGANHVESASALAVTSVVAFTLEGPIFHAMHDDYGWAAASFAVRVTSTLVAAAMSASVDHCPDKEFCSPEDQLGLGLLVGMGVASLLDVFVLTPYPQPAKPQVQPSRATKVSFAPSLLLSGERTMVGLGGRF